MPILVCRAIPGRKSVHFIVQNKTKKAKMNTLCMIQQSKKRCSTEKHLSYLNDISFSEKRRQEIKKQPCQKYSIAYTYQLVVKSLEKFLIK